MLFLKRKKSYSADGQGLILFDQVPDAMKAERCLKESGYKVKLVAPPPEIRKGCDLAVQINLVEQPGIDRVLTQKGADFIEIVHAGANGAEILDIVKVKDFGNATMVKAGNMKLSFDNKTGVVLNTSGGGCPDIPYLHAEMLNKKLTEAPRPRQIGFTLCALMLDRALEECLEIWKGGNRKC